MSPPKYHPDVEGVRVGLLPETPLLVRNRRSKTTDELLSYRIRVLAGLAGRWAFAIGRFAPFCAVARLPVCLEAAFGVALALALAFSSSMAYPA